MGRRRNKKLKSPSPLPPLPEEIITAEILPRLPVETLVRFRCVCKSWQRLLSNRDFKFSTQGRERAVLCTSQLTLEQPLSIYRRSRIYLLDHQLAAQEVPPPVEKVKKTDYIHILGSCDGLLLICHARQVYLWNPTTRCCRRLPQLSTDDIPVFPSGLWYDESSNHYKAVLTSHYDLVVASLGRRVRVKKIKFPYYIALRKLTKSGLLVNGFLHWIVCKKSSKYRCLEIIICFDNRVNQFKELPLPEPSYRGNVRFQLIFGLGVLDRCLCMSRDGKSLGGTDLLMMTEYGVKESWTTLFTIPSSYPFHQLVPVFFSTKSNEDILVADLDGAIWDFNLKDNSLKKIELPSQPHNEGPVTYVESLASVC